MSPFVIIYSLIGWGCIPDFDAVGLYEADPHPKTPPRVDSRHKRLPAAYG